jgi:transcriptional regulator
MFIRPCWQPTSPEDTLSIIEQHPWALLVSNDVDGPLATNLPLLLDPSSREVGAPLILAGHLARSNGHVKQLSDAAAPSLAIFEGPWSYVTASWYPGRDMPSTYYYTAVHCYGTLEFQDTPALDSSLEDLIQKMESGFPNGWKTSEVPREEITRRFAALIGFRMLVTRVEAKFKLGQDEPIRDAIAVAGHLEKQEEPNTRVLAQLIRKHNQARIP